jgi:hypothetical protein
MEEEDDISVLLAESLQGDSNFCDLLLQSKRLRCNIICHGGCSSTSKPVCLPVSIHMAELPVSIHTTMAKMMHLSLCAVLTMLLSMSFISCSRNSLTGSLHTANQASSKG